MAEQYRYTRTVEVEIEIRGDVLALRFCDAQVAQWSIPIGYEADYERLASVIASLIEGEADDLAESLVKDLRRDATSD